MTRSRCWFLRQLRDEGKIGMIGVSTPEQDQSCVIQLMRDGLVDTVQIIFNLFRSGTGSPTAARCGRNRYRRDRSRCSGRRLADGQVLGRTSIPDDDFRSRYFAGDRMERTAARVEEIRRDIEQFGLADQYSLADVAIKFALARTEVSSVIVGMRSVAQVEDEHESEPTTRPASRVDTTPSPTQLVARRLVQREVNRPHTYDGPPSPSPHVRWTSKSVATRTMDFQVRRQATYDGLPSPSPSVRWTSKSVDSNHPAQPIPSRATDLEVHRTPRGWRSLINVQSLPLDDVDA